MSNITPFLRNLEPENYKLNESLAEHTTVGIGGPAEIWYEAPNNADFVRTVKLARQFNLPVTVLGGGSNVLISDQGLPGLVIRNKAKKISIINSQEDSEQAKKVKSNSTQEARWQADKTKGNFKYNFKDLDYDESDQPRATVQIETGCNLQQAMQALFDAGITGWQWYARIPGTIGGAIFNNIHGGTHFFNENLTKVWVLDLKSLEEKILEGDQLKSGYDQTGFHQAETIILKGEFQLYQGDVAKAQYVVKEWTKRKASVQPMNTPGCAFQNISNEDKVKLGYPTPATGYIIDKVLGISKFHVGDAWISNSHSNFIENKGNASAKDYLDVIREIQKRAKEQIGVKIKLEILLLGFDSKEIADIYQATDSIKLKNLQHMPFINI